MQEYMKKFSVEDVQLYREQNEDPDFAYVELWALAEGNNSHRNPFSKEVLERDAHTFKGKFIVAKYDKFQNDTEGHELDEIIIGYVPPNEELEFKNKEVDGVEKEFVVAKGVLSKIYAKEVVDLFRTNNGRTVSCEFSCATQYEENEYGRAIDDNGLEMDVDNPVLSYHIHGITVLGLKYNPSVAGTEIKVKQFAEKCEQQSLKQFAEERKEKLKLVSHPMDKSKDAVDMGDWNGDKAKNDLLKEKNFKTLAKSVCLLLEDGWGEKKKGALKYPVMNLKDGKWVYNAEGLSSARAYGEQHDPSVADKAISIQKRLGLYKDDKEDTMSTKKEFAVDIGNIWCSVCDILTVKYPDKDYGSIYRVEGVYEENGQKFAIIYKKDETALYKIGITFDDADNIILGEEIVEVEKTYLETDNVKKFSDEGVDPKYKTFEEKKDIIMEEPKEKEMAQDENKEEQPKDEDKEMGCDKEMSDDEDDELEDEDDKEENPQEEEKKFSLDAYVDQVAMLAMLENETEENKKLADEVMKQMSANEIVEKFVQMAKENAELKIEKEKSDKEKRDKKFSAIMASVKEDLDAKLFSELSEEGKDLTLEQLGAFENKVKAFAYEATKNNQRKEDDGIMRFAGVDNSQNNQDSQDVFDRLSKM